MEPDFEGWATKANLMCADGRTIAPGAFKHQDSVTVPLVWQHGHNNAENVLGHAVLHDRDEGVWMEGFFNSTGPAQHAKQAVQHKDIKHMSIWANQLMERSKLVLHGMIKEVSLVLGGANPGALIDNMTIRHDDGSDTFELEDEYRITTGEEIYLAHDDSDDELSHADEDGPTMEEVYDSMNEDQKTLLAAMLTDALSHSDDEDDASDASDDADESDESDDAEGDEIDDAEEDQLQHDNTGSDAEEGTDTMAHNVFDKTGQESGTQTVASLSHADVAAIFDKAQKNEMKLSDAARDYATDHLEHSVETVDLLFPDAKAIDGAVPEWIKRETEWVAKWLPRTRKSPFSRIKTLQADLTHDEARAKGYITGSLKKEQFFGMLKRVTTPQTVYKKQSIDRDDWVDITDFDVVMWLKAEMRVQLDEEIARAGLIGDGRDVDDPDKIDETHIRPIATDKELYTTQVTVDMTGPAAFNKFVDAMANNRRYYKGTGTPTFYTTEVWIAQALTLRDSLGRKIYRTLAELAEELRVSEIVPVEVMESDPTLIGIMVNPVDYVYGATRGGEVNLFDDFDIDYNKQKYLIEARCCGALVKVKAAVVFRKAEAETDPATATKPVLDSDDYQLHVPSITGVLYFNGLNEDITGDTITLSAGQMLEVFARADEGYYLADGDHFWTFVRPTT